MAQFRQLAAGKLRQDFPQITPAAVDLFLHIPVAVSPTVYAVRLTWMDNNARLDFACASFQQHCGAISDGLERFQALSATGKPPAQMAADLEQALQNLTGIASDDRYRQFPSLAEQRRHEPYFQQMTAVLGPL